MRWHTTITTLAVAMALPAMGAAQVLDFQGLQNQEQILDFYNGGAGGFGSTGGTNYGISFGTGALAVIDADDGGTGNIENNPAGSTVAFWLGSDGLVMNVLGGFTSGFSFYYSSAVDAVVNVWSGLNATGTLLASLNLRAQFNENCPPYAPGRTGAYCNWTAMGVLFAGTAMSVDFGGTANYTAYDLITLRSDVPGVPVPEPGTLLLLATGLAGVIAARRRRGLEVESL